jgi:hypothetical protein
MTKAKGIPTTTQDNTPDFAELLRVQAASAVETLTHTVLPLVAKMERRELAEEIRRRALAACELFANTPLPPPGPCAIGHGETRASILRRVARLRAGVMEPSDPTTDPAEMADRLEKQSEYRDAAMDACRTTLEVLALMSVELMPRLKTLEQQAVETFDAAKQLPEASKPGSDLSHQIRQLHRARRASQGSARPDGPKRRRRPGKR